MRGTWLSATILVLQVAISQANLTPVSVDMAKAMDPPLVKKFGVFNSGIVPQSRYTPDILASLGAIKASSLRIDLSIGKFDSGFTYLMRPNTNGGQDSSNFDFSLIDTLADGLKAQKVLPYWGLNYNPAPFQPDCVGGFGSSTCQGSSSTCRGFEDQSNVPGTNNYICTPRGGSFWDDCWKCPPKFRTGNAYQEWADTIGLFHEHFYQRGITPVYEESWNEPDLTEYYNPTLSAYKGQSQDFIDMYESTARALLARDQDATIGGNAVANQIRHNPAYPKQPNNEDSLKSAAANGIPMDFFSFHSITSEPGIDQVALMVSRNQISREVLSSPELQQITGPLNPYDTTEMHCNEFFPNSTTDTLTTAYASSAHLATVLLESWSILLEETDLAQAHWAQYMDVFDNSAQIGLIDFQGNPRPAWYAFKWFAELPVERKMLRLDSPYIRGMAGFDARSCSGGVLLWNVPTPQNGLPSAETDVQITIRNMPIREFTVEAFVIDDRRFPSTFLYTPSWSDYNARANPHGGYSFPPLAYNGLKVPVNGTVYVKFTPHQCRQGSVLPKAKLVKIHHYYGMRPRKTTQYAYFQQRDWSVYLGMGKESTGYAIAGFTIQAYNGGATPSRMGVNMNIVEGSIQRGGIAGVRVDLPIRPPGQPTNFPQLTSYFFYQAGTSPCVVRRAARSISPGLASSAQTPRGDELDLSAGPLASPPKAIQGQDQPSNGTFSFSNSNTLAGSTDTAGRKLLQAREYPCGEWENNYIQIPQHWGSKKPVWAVRFIPVDLKNFSIDFKSLAADTWEGRATVLFVMKDGTPGTKVQAYITEQQ